MTIICPPNCTVAKMQSLMTLTTKRRSRYSADLEDCWRILENWFEGGANLPVPLTVLVAFRKLATAPVPGEGVTGVALCPLSGMAQFFEGGIVLPAEVSKAFAEELDEAWTLVTKWLNTMPENGFIPQNKLDPDVRAALDKMLTSVVPGTEEMVYGKDVKSLIIINERILSC